jgi:purine-cytosine permease-like protein
VHTDDKPVGAGAETLSSIEKRSIDHVPVSERRGRVWHQGPFWFTGNCNFFTIAIGFVGPALGLGFWPTCLASLLGLAFGTVFMALHATQGPDLGLPQMVQSRAQFGYRGVFLPLLATLFTFLGFNVIDTVLVSQGLQNLVGVPPLVSALALAAAAVLLATYGYDWLHRIFRVLFWLSLPAYLALSIAIATGHIAGSSSVTLESFTWVAFASQFAVAASYNITFAPYVSDYTRYLPPGQSPLLLMASVYLGAALSSIWLIALGAWLAVHLGASDGMIAIKIAGDQLFSGGGLLVIGISVLALAAAMGLNAYSGMLTVVTAVDSVRKLEPTRGLRVICILILAFVWLAIAWAIDESAIGALYTGLTVMLYLLAPWSAINLIDYFILRRRKYAIAELFTPTGIYGQWNKVGLFCYVVGLLVGVPFFSLPGVFVGPVAQLLGGADLAWLPELAVSAALYYLFMHRRDFSHEWALAEKELAAVDPAPEDQPAALDANR